MREKKEYTEEERVAIEKYCGSDMLKFADVEHLIKDCPFCGKEAKYAIALGGFLIECTTSKCVQPCIVLPKIESALERWNRRD